MSNIKDESNDFDQQRKSIFGSFRKTEESMGQTTLNIVDTTPEYDFKYSLVMKSLSVLNLVVLYFDLLGIFEIPFPFIITFFMQLFVIFCIFLSRKKPTKNHRVLFAFAAI